MADALIADLATIGSAASGLRLADPSLHSLASREAAEALSTLHGVGVGNVTWDVCCRARVVGFVEPSEVTIATVAARVRAMFWEATRLAFVVHVHRLAPGQPEDSGTVEIVVRATA